MPSIFTSASASMYAVGLAGAAGLAGVTLLANKVKGMKEARRRQRGPCCILEIGGCELVEKANQGFDWKDPFGGIFLDGRPDLKVKWQHGSTSGATQVENNTYHAVWMSSLKIPYEEQQGFIFQVVDVDDFNGDDVIGRCYCSIEEAREAMRTNEPLVLSLGQSIGKLKVSMHGPMNFANSVLSKEGQDTQEQLSTKRAAKPKAAGGAPGTAADKGKTLKEGDASVPAPPLPPSSPATAAVAAVAVAAAPVAPKSSV